MVNRTVRILPVYYAALVVTLVAAGGGTPREWLLYATFSQNAAIAPNDQVDRVMWFMVIEVHFYLVLPLLAALIGTVARGSRARAVAVLAALGGASFALFHYAWHIDPRRGPHCILAALDVLFPRRRHGARRATAALAGAATRSSARPGRQR